MKNTVIIAILTLNFALLTSKCFAQPNPGFENWSTVFGLQEPDGYQTFNFLSLTTPPNPLSAFKATGIDKHSGNYALKLKTVFLNNNVMPQIFPDTLGAVFVGKITPNPVVIKLGYPYAGRPEKLQFWAKYQSVGNDSGRVGVVLKKWNGSGIDTIALGFIAIGQTPQFTLFEIPLSYKLAGLPDSAGILLSSSKGTNDARVGSTMFIDDLAFAGWVGIDEHDLYTDKVKAFPNPAKDIVNIVAQLDKADNVQLFDLTCKLIGVYKIENYTANINTSAFAKGIYFYEIRDTKEGFLTSGKFNVIK